MNHSSHFFALLVLFLLLSCAPSLDRSLLTSEGPQVVSLSPNTGARVGLVPSIDVHFSEPILDTTVTEKSFIIARLPEDETFGPQGTAATAPLEADASERISGSLAFTGDRLGVTWEPAESLSAGAYQVILLPLIKSVTHRPLNDSGFLGTQPFVSWFVVVTDDVNEGESSLPVNNNDNSLSDTTETEEDEDTIDPVETQEIPELGDTPSPSAETPPDVEAAPPARTGLIITEVVTDPQRDWNDTSGGNGTFFDRFPGTGTIGSSDEWVELSNRSDESLSLKDWRLDMIDGSDATEFFGQPSSTLQFSLGGSIDKVLSGECVVIGNPPGDMKNSLLLRLIDNEEKIVDEVNIEDANAEGIFDEAYQWDDEDGWKRGESTIGF